jgi:hypothetical protein
LKRTIEELCRDLGVAAPKRLGRQLNSEEPKDLFQSAPTGVHFWIPDAFHGVVERIPPEQCYRFWKREVQHRLLENSGFVREAWPDGYAYLAQAWRSPYAEPLVELLRCE